MRIPPHHSRRSKLIFRSGKLRASNMSQRPAECTKARGEGGDCFGWLRGLLTYLDWFNQWLTWLNSLRITYIYIYLVGKLKFEVWFFVVLWLSKWRMGPHLIVTWSVIRGLQAICYEPSGWLLVNHLPRYHVCRPKNQRLEPPNEGVCLSLYFPGVSLLVFKIATSMTPLDWAGQES